MEFRVLSLTMASSGPLHFGRTRCRSTSDTQKSLRSPGANAAAVEGLPPSSPVFRTVFFASSYNLVYIVTQSASYPYAFPMPTLKGSIVVCSTNMRQGHIKTLILSFEAPLAIFRTR